MPILFNRRRLLSAVGAGGLAFGVAPNVFAQAPAATKPLSWVKMPAVRFPALSGDGMHDVTLAAVDTGQALVAFDVAAAKPSRIDIGDVVVDQVTWIGNNHVAVVTSVPQRRIMNGGGPGSVRLANIYSLTGKSRITVFEAIANFQAGVVSDLKPIVRGGKAMVAAVSHHGPESDFAYLYAIDPDTGKGEMLDRGPRETSGWIIQPDGTPVARSAYYFHNRGWTAEYYSSGSWKQMYHTTVDIHAPRILGLGRDGNSVVVRMPDDGDAGVYCEMSPDGTLSAPLVDDATTREPIFHPTSFRLVGFTHTIAGWPQYEFSDPSLASLLSKAQAATPGYRMRLDAWSDDAGKAIVYSEGDDDSGTWYYIDFSKGVSMEVGLAYPDLAPEAFADKKPFAYKAGDGASIEGFLALPPGKASTGLPLVVLAATDMEKPHTLAVDWRVEALTAAGYAVFSANPRGSWGYGKAFAAAGYGQWGGKRLTDLSDGVAALVAQGTVDPKRVAIMGSGEGGYAALSGVTLQSGIYTCAIDIGGMADITAMMNLVATGPEGVTSPFYRYYARQFGTSDFDSISPAHFADHAGAPILILHSQDDPDVQYQQSTRMAGALRSAGKDVTFITTKSTDDWTLTQVWRDEVMTPVLDFLAKHNPA